MSELFTALEAALAEPDPAAKCAAVDSLVRLRAGGRLRRRPGRPPLPVDRAGRPARPRLVDPRDLPRRGAATAEGRLRLLHAIAHIEFNAINIALDAAYRFRELPPGFADDWLAVAADEARHFRLLGDELAARGAAYGDFDAHAGLWDMVARTGHDPLHRMALVPRVMEARGLDVTPAMIARFRQFGDDAAARILEVIYRDEIGHVRIGDRWYRTLCAARGLEPGATFRDLLQRYLGGKPRGPFNREARIAAGFSAEEIDRLES